MTSRGEREELETVLGESKALADLLKSLQENLVKVSDKNENLLEAIESSEARAGQSTSGEAAILRNLRARLATCHTPNAVLRRDLATFAGIFEKRYADLLTSSRHATELRSQLDSDRRDLDQRLSAYERERRSFEDEKAQWKENQELERADMMEQNDRLAVLSEQLAGVRVDLDSRRSELASQRIAFEEEKLAQLGSEVTAVDSEAEALRLKLKEQVLRNVQLEEALLHTELSLHSREQAGREAEARNSRLARDVLNSRLASSRAVKQFEKRTVDANKKLAQMNSELASAQEHARRFQELLAAERRKQKVLKHALEQELQRKATSAGGLPPSPSSAGAQRAYVDALTDTLSRPHKPHSPGRLEDIVRRNEAVLVDNSRLRADVSRLRVENSDLLRRVRFADTNAHYMRNQVVTNVADRAELLKRLDKAEAQYRELEQSLSRQASDWVAARQREGRAEKTVKWKQVEPIPVLGASERTWNVATTRSQSQSRSIHVHKW